MTLERGRGEVVLSDRGISVVICVYTEDRWEDILAAVASVRRPVAAGPRDAAGGGPQPGAARPAPGPLQEYARGRIRYGDKVRVLANAGPRGLSAGRNTGIAAARRRDHRLPRRRRGGRARLAAALRRGVRGPAGDGGRRAHRCRSGRRGAGRPGSPRSSTGSWAVRTGVCRPGRVRVRNVLGGNASFRSGGVRRVGRLRRPASAATATSARWAARRPSCASGSRRARPDAVLLIDDRAVIHHRVPDARRALRATSARRAYAEGLSKALVARSVGARQGLESERRYTTRVLPAGVARGLRDALLAPAGRRGPGGRDRRRGGGRGGRVRGGERCGPAGAHRLESSVGGDRAESGAVEAVPAREGAAA